MSAENKVARFNIEAMKWAAARLTVEDFGRLAIELTKAADETNCEAQRLLLELFQHRERMS